METFLAILLLMTLALGATSPRIYKLRRFPAISVLMNGGWPAVLAGLLMGPDGVGLISREVLRDSTPLLMMGLGWVGFVIGLQARREVLVQVVGETLRLVLTDVILTLLVVGGASWLILSWWTGGAGAAWLAAPVALLTAASMGWSMETRSLLRERTARAQHLAILLRAAGTLCSIGAILWFGLVYEFPRRDVSGVAIFDWLRGGQRLVVATLAAVLMGVLGQVAFRRAGRDRAPQLVVSLGIVVFVAGLATELTASPLFAAMLTGVVIANLSGKEFQRFERFIIQAEHVVAILLALLAGLLLEVSLAGPAILLAATLMLVRIVIKPVIVRLGLPVGQTDDGGLAEVRQLTLTGPMRQNPLAIALAVGVVLAEDSIFNRQLLTVIVACGLILDFGPVILSWATRRAGAAVAGGGVS